MMSVTLQQLVSHDFELARWKATWRHWLGRLARKRNDLLSFEQIRQGVRFTGQHDLGLQNVPLNKIVGSVGRSGDFDRAFFPRQAHIKDRWMNIDKAYYQDVLLPAVELIKIGEMYFVSDGNHRVSVARVHGQDFIDAHVIEINASVPAR